MRKAIQRGGNLRPWPSNRQRRCICGSGSGAGGGGGGMLSAATGGQIGIRGRLSGCGRSSGARELQSVASNDKDMEEVVLYSTSSRKKTVDKTGILLGGKHFPMDRPLPGLPPLKPARELVRPETQTTTLDNGFRVASQETYGQLCSFGLVADLGSRNEGEANVGACHLMELMSFKSTKTRTHQQVVSEFEEMGAMVSAHGSREQLLYCVDVLRDNLEPAMALLADSVLTPLLTHEEVQEQKAVIQYHLDETTADGLMKEALMAAAYPGHPLGQPYLCPPSALPGLHAEMVRDLRGRHLLAPNMVLAGAGVDHMELVDLGRRHFQGIPTLGPGGEPAPPVAKSVYSGGEARLSGVHKEPLTRVAVAFQVGGWHDDLLVATCVLQVLLGGGDSFSAGGPGKGMYSRLYREVLNRYYWAEAAEAFTSIHDETGLLGIAGAAADKNKASQLMHVFCEHFAKLATQPVTNEELSRARNMLRCNVLTHLESRLVLFEDIGRQMLTYGRRESPEEICRKIDSVTTEDIMTVAQRALKTAPTIAMVGGDTEGMPTWKQVCGWFGLRQPQPASE
ncbi:unnamed protein product [Discosporangium mesarthrocarpum]